MILLLVLLALAHYESVVVTSLRLFGVSIDNSGNLLIEDAVVDVGLLGVEVFVERGADDAVRVYRDTKLFCGLADVGVVPRCGRRYLRSPPS